MNDEQITAAAAWWYVVAFIACVLWVAFIGYAVIHFVVKFW